MSWTAILVLPVEQSLQNPADLGLKSVSTHLLNRAGTAIPSETS